MLCFEAGRIDELQKPIDEVPCHLPAGRSGVNSAKLWAADSDIVAALAQPAGSILVFVAAHSQQLVNPENVVEAKRPWRGEVAFDPAEGRGRVFGLAVYLIAAAGGGALRQLP
jgi:hypothetical protein